MDVEPDSPAARAGLRSGDVVVGFDDKTINGAASLRNHTFSLPSGTRATLKFYRDGKSTTTQVTIAEMPTLVSLGIRLRDVPHELARRLPGAPDSAVVVEHVAPARPPRTHLFRGMRVLEVGPKGVSTKLEAERAAAAVVAEKGVHLLVQSPNGQETEVTIGGPVRHNGIER